MKSNNLLVKFLIWRIKHIPNRNFILMLSGVIGIVTGFAAVTLKTSVHYIQDFLTSSFDIKYANYLYIGYPLVGILLTLFIAKFFFGERLGHGITNILYAISKKSGIISRTKIYSRMITSALTVGLGGSVGLEAPVIVTGSAIGSNIGTLMHLNYKRRTLLIGCGAAGAISAIFNSPIAGVIFSIEIILAEVTIAAFIPLLMASVCGALVSLLLLGDNVMFYFELTDPLSASDIPFYILLGLLCGLGSVYFTRITYKIEDLVNNIKNDVSKAVIGGIALGLIVFVFPPIYGEGYSTIKTLLAGQDTQILNSSPFFQQTENTIFLIIFMVGVALVKPVASALTVGAGGSGGLFAPSLFLGGMAGYLYAKMTNLFLGTSLISTSNFTLVGMCGLMSGVLHAPLTAIFLIAEITSGYTLFVPLMLVSAIAYSTSSYFETYSVYTKRLIEKGDLIPHDKDRQVLSLIHLNKIIEKDLLKIHPDATLGDLVDLVRVSRRNIFPVVDREAKLVGIVTLDDIRELMFDEKSRKNIYVKSLMHSPPESVSSYENMLSVMGKFEKTGAWNLPVIDDEKYVGFVSKSRIFNAYRTKLIRQHSEYAS